MYLLSHAEQQGYPHVNPVFRDALSPDAVIGADLRQPRWFKRRLCACVHRVDASIYSYVSLRVNIFMRLASWQLNRGSIMQCDGYGSIAIY